MIILSVVLVVAVISFFPIKAFSDRATRQSALAQAKASEKSGNIDLALRHMERYVAAWPTDLAGLEYQAKLLADTAQPQNLAQMHGRRQTRTTRFCGSTPMGPSVRTRGVG